ncbi:hypothetical protein GXP67_07130 [Rhodocytophaga rosea]|uniref:Uncharacterized protein n=1 Tax=Rhodocytophaga rosea TaxID=2704465 RepID=A0A6C0GEP8_9BACT|nr:hypothetical protein [Rhodocytophaga rosea]QHT66446.1 hypothetical protein GXP67_07130 [Rhodocytophaga rosea]
MPLLVKIVFFIPLLINGLIALFYWGATLFSLIKPPSAYYTTRDGFIFITGYTVILALLAWAYHLAIVQHKTVSGFRDIFSGMADTHYRWGTFF